MTANSFFTITCPVCDLTSTVPVEALLVSLAVEDEGLEPVADTDTDERAQEAGDVAAVVAWTCPSCDDLASIRIEWTTLLRLVTAGVVLLDEGSDEPAPPHPETPAPGATLTRDDLLALHELLESDTWFDAVDPDRHESTSH